jgi:predicted kinase
VNLTIPDLSLVVLIGVSGSGKSTFAPNIFSACWRWRANQLIRGCEGEEKAPNSNIQAPVKLQALQASQTNLRGD